MENNRNNNSWFDVAQDVDNFLFEEFNEMNIDFPIIDEYNPQNNTIEAIKKYKEESLVRFLKWYVSENDMSDGIFDINHIVNKYLNKVN